MKPVDAPETATPPRTRRDTGAPRADLPSFTRALFLGDIHHEFFFPYPAPLSERSPDEAAVVRRVLRDLRTLEKELIDPAQFDADEKIPEEVLRAFADIGMFGLNIPKKYGGLGLSATGYGRVFSTLCSIDPSLAVVVGVHCGLGSKSIVLFGDQEQKEQYLPKLAKAEMFAAYALTEPNVGSDAQHVESRAVRAPGDDGWLITGRKIWIGLGHRAGVITTFAQTEIVRRGEKVLRPTAFLVRPDTPGFKVLGTFSKLGIRGSTQAELEYKDVFVPDDHVLHETGRGFAVAVNVLNAGRHSLSCGCTAGTRKLLGEMTTYASKRVQFGKPIIEFEITQRKIASTAIDLYAAESMVGVLSALMDSGDADVALEAACAKVFSSEMLWRTADEMVQIAGGRGFVKPHPYERYLRDARINRIFEGTNEILRLFIALSGLQEQGEKLKELGEALKRPLRNLGQLGEFASSRVLTAFGRGTDLKVDFHDSLRGHERYFEQHVAEFKRAAEDAVMQYRQRIVEHQFVLERLANMAIELFARAATLSRTQKLIDDRGADACAHEISVCGMFCVESGRRFRGNRNALDEREEELDGHRRGIAAAVRSAGGAPTSDPVLAE
ncbi:MAG TPA: acyl-CoA dehydrogenase family protein [Gemmatimonadaceae bacterium]|nr:acyl-CoA dehydrogenase family protein [Gemmatimonadaceae bacterium]